MKNSSKINTKRDLNIELLRIILMFLILLIHANAVCLPIESKNQINLFRPFIFFFIEAVTYCAVPTFILISGWYGIHATKKGILKFLFQCLFFTIGIYIVNLFTRNAVVNLYSILRCFFLSTDDGYWFIRSYIFLYILSPILNAFIKNASYKQYKIILICFFLYQTFFGWSNIDVEFNRGFSTIYFIGLYLVAHYVRLYSPIIFQYSIKRNLIIFISLSFCISILAYINSSLSLPGPKYFGMYSYLSPFIILNSIYLFLIFKGIKISKNRFISIVAPSCLSVYLFHCNIYIYNDFLNIVSNYRIREYGYLLIILFLILVYIISIIIDLFRKFIWEIIEKASIKD